MKYQKEIKRITDQIARKYKPEKIILFGSYAWGKPTKDSDVDLFIVKKSSESRFERQRKLRELLFDDNFSAIDILVYNPDEVEKSVNKHKNLFIEDILRNGRVLYSKPKSSFAITLSQKPLTILHKL